MEKEKEGKTYTTTEVMEISGLTRASVLKRARMFGFTKYCRYVLKRTCWGNYIKEFTFTESQVRQMGCDHLVSRRAIECESQDNESDDTETLGVIEKLKKEHPLVTNENCFKKNWWPEVIPSVFQDDEE